jgi:transcriptional regulator with XRE-family HTH domain
MKLAPAEVRAARLARHWSEQDLAERAGISLLSVIRYESGRKLANESVATAVAAALEEATETDAEGKSGEFVEGDCPEV